MFDRYYRLILILVMAFIPCLGFAARGKVELLPKDGGPPVSLSPSIGVGALAGRFASPVGIAVNAIQLCVELQCINMVAGRAAKPPAVPGWADPTVPPSSVAGYQRWVTLTSLGGFDTPESACQAFVVYKNSIDSVFRYEYYDVTNITATTGTCRYDQIRLSNGVSEGINGFGLTKGNFCPVGYSYSGGTCALSDESAVKWPSDAIDTYYDPNTGVWTPYPRDPDTGSISPPATLPAYDEDEHGNKNKTTVTPQADGGVKTTQLTEGTNPQTGRTEVSKHEVTTNSAGDVVNYTYQVFENTTLEQISNTTQVGTIELPDDYAREQTLQEVRDSLKVTPQSIPANLEDSLVAPLEGIQQEIENLTTDFPNNPAPDITVPPYWEYATGTCYPATWDVGRFGEVSLETFCEIYDDHVRGILDWMIAVWGVIYLYFYWGQVVKEI
jgi:hypothetical protein